MRKSRPNGFSLIELLMVIGILGVLMGLTVPAVSRVRKSAARSTCSNNLRQLALASHSYASINNGLLPPGFLGPAATSSAYDMSNQCVGIFPHILPFMEENALATQFMSGLPDDYLSPFQTSKGGTNTQYSPWCSKSTAGPWTLRGANIKTLRCPADDTGNVNNVILAAETYLSGTTKKFTVWKYSVSSTITSNMVNSVGRSNYLGVGGSYINIDTPSRGAFLNRVQTNIGKIPDGSSQTLLFGEYLGGPEKTQRQHAMSWIGAGAYPTVYGLPSDTGVQLTYDYRMFGGNHQNVVMFVNADGSVHPIRKGTGNYDMETLAGTSEGRQPPSVFAE